MRFDKLIGLYVLEDISDGLGGHSQVEKFVMSRYANVEELSLERYPMLGYAIEAINKGSVYPTILNAANAVIAHFTGYALWTVSPESTSFILLIGVSWELSLMFSIAGFTADLLPEDKNKKILGINNRIVFAIAQAFFFSVFEIFLASTPSFIWVYKWWGALPVFITTYIPFFLAAYLVYTSAERPPIRLSLHHSSTKSAIQSL